MIKLRFLYLIKYKFYLKEKRSNIKKQWTIVNDVHTELFTGEVNGCLQLTLKYIFLKNGLTYQ